MPEGIFVFTRHPGVARLGPAIALNGLLGLALVAADEGIGIDVAIEVASFVLQAAGKKAVALYSDVVAVLVPVLSAVAAVTPVATC